MLRAVMHGYYISTGTYNKAKQLAKPITPANVVKQKLKDTLAEKNTHKLKATKEVSRPSNVYIDAFYVHI